MRALVMTVTIVQAGECSAAFIALETNDWRGRGLNGRSRGVRKRRRVWVVENSRDEGWGRGDVLDLMGLTVVILLALLLLLLLLLLLVRPVGLERWWL